MPQLFVQNNYKPLNHQDHLPNLRHLAPELEHFDLQKLKVWFSIPKDLYFIYYIPKSLSRSSKSSKSGGTSRRSSILKYMNERHDTNFS